MSKLTLHEAMQQVIPAGTWVSPSRISKDIGRLGLYTRRDGLPPPPK